jgi:hypothetical protein
MNDRLVEIIKAQPTRFYGLGSVAPQDPEQAAREIKRIMGPLGLGGQSELCDIRDETKRCSLWNDLSSFTLLKTVGE